MKVLVAGDYAPSYRIEQALNKQDYESIFHEIKALTSTVDCAIVNFETTIAQSGDTPIKKNGPNLCCTRQALEALTYAVFDVVTLANNHFYDYGDAGVEQTLKICQEQHIATVGGGRNINEASQIKYRCIQGQSIALINCCEHEFSIATTQHGGSCPLNPIQQFYQIQEAKAKADYVLVIIHGGHEHYPLPSPRMQETYRFFIDAGADAIINHHQHCYSGYEIYKNKPIFYGLGNFCFDTKSKAYPLWNEGYLVELNFSSTGITFQLHPFQQCMQTASVKLLTNKQDFFKRIEQLNHIITQPDALQAQLELFYKQNTAVYELPFQPYFGRYLKAAFYRKLLPSFLTKQKTLQALNMVMCESHRDKLIYHLKHLIQQN